jgi:hypothetical protein
VRFITQVKPTRRLKKKVPKSEAEKPFFARTFDDLGQYVNTFTADCRSSFVACWKHLEGTVGLVVDVVASVVSLLTSGESRADAKHANVEL